MNKKLKVIQLIDSLNPGGAEMMAVNIANELGNEDGKESHVCATRLEGNLKTKIEKSVGYLFLNKKYTFDLKAIIKLNSYIKLHKISIVHAHSSSYFIGFLVKLLNPKLKLIWHDHYGESDYIASRSTFPLAFISNYFKMAIAVNSTLLAWNKKNLNASNYTYLPNFASLSQNMIKKTFLHGANGKRILCLANLRPQKDHLNLLNAYLIIKKTAPNWTLHLIGADNQDRCSEEIKTFIKGHTLENDVFLYGSCSDTAHILEQATIGVLSSQSEGLPVALLEYGVANLPVVVTDVGECSTVVHHKKSGLVVPSKNNKELATMLITLIEDANLRDYLGNILKQTVQENYSKNTYIKTLLHIYKFEA